MKYITKEWYVTSQEISFLSHLRVSKKAGVFSEDYFRKIYKNAERALLLHLEELSKIQNRDIYIFADEFQNQDADNHQLEPSENTKANSEKGVICLKVEPFIFDLEQERKNYKERFQNTVDKFKRNLPKEILQKVIDIRVLALGYATTNIKKEITAYCKINKKSVDAAADAYWKDFDRNFKSDEPAFLEEFNFHDCTVISCRKSGEDRIITFNSTDSFKTIKQIILKNCSIIKQDKLLHGARWLYDEIYKIEGGYEIHVLLDKKELIDYIVTVTDVKYR